MNSNVLFDIANRLARLEYEMDQSKNTLMNVQSIRNTTDSQHDAIISIYSSLGTIHNSIREVQDCIADINRRLIALERK